MLARYERKRCYLTEIEDRGAASLLWTAVKTVMTTMSKNDMRLQAKRLRCIRSGF